MANTQEEPDNAELYNEGNADILSQAEDHFTIKNLLSPSNTKPSRLSGSIVNICTSAIGETHKKTQRKQDESA